LSRDVDGKKLPSKDGVATVHPTPRCPLCPQYLCIYERIVGDMSSVSGNELDDGETNEEEED
jgi:hypothetical protein